MNAYGRGSWRPASSAFDKQCPLRAMYVHQIQSGKKTVEGRVYLGPFKHWRVDDKIRFHYQQNPNDDVICRITHITVYRTFREMLEKEGVNNCLADIKDLEEGVRIYNGIPGYAEKAKEFGVVAFDLRVIKIGNDSKYRGQGLPPDDQVSAAPRVDRARERPEYKREWDRDRDYSKREVRETYPEEDRTQATESDEFGKIGRKRSRPREEELSPPTKRTKSEVRKDSDSNPLAESEKPKKED